MSRALLIAELATAHGGNLEIASDLIRASAAAGADLVKIQSYSLKKLNPADPQRAWLTAAHLDKRAHDALLTVAEKAGIELFSTPFDSDSLAMLRNLGLRRFKVASSESANAWWEPQKGEHWIVSWPWGRVSRSYVAMQAKSLTTLTAIPLYPTPLECAGQATLLDGWSDHGEGIAACQWALAQGSQMLEVHVWHGQSRRMPFDKSMAELTQLRRFAEDVATMRTGVSEKFRTRWRA